MMARGASLIVFLEILAHLALCAHLLDEPLVEALGEIHEILDVKLPKVRVPLNPGKNITVIAEVIAMNHLLKYSGVDTAAVFNNRLMGRMRQAADVRRYLQEDDE